MRTEGTWKCWILSYPEVSGNCVWLTGAHYPALTCSSIFYTAYSTCRTSWFLMQNVDKGKHILYLLIPLWRLSFFMSCMFIFTPHHFYPLHLSYWSQIINWLSLTFYNLYFPYSSSVRIYVFLFNFTSPEVCMPFCWYLKYSLIFTNLNFACLPFLCYLLCPMDGI